ncbi:MAG: amidohydrolase family protein [Flavobacteriaceae bacterium]
MKITKHLFYYVLFFISTLGYTQSSILIKNAQVWDGLSDTVQPNTSVLIQDNLIVAVGPSIRAPRGAQIIDARGKTLIPGLSDAHVHLTLTEGMQKIRGEAHWMYTALRAGVSAEHFLQLGFTTVRDLGGPVFGLKKAIDEGLVPGPRIYPSGAFISQTSGHGDSRNPNEPNPYWAGNSLHPIDALGWAFVVDGRTEVLKAARENLRQGATQLKVMAGGGIDSEFDPIHSVQFTPDELRAAVEAAEDWDTYVAVHIYNSEGAIRALEAGVKCLDHGHLLNEVAIKLIKEKQAWLVPQAYWIDAPADFWAPGQDRIPPETLKKVNIVLEGTQKQMDLAKKYNLKLGFGSDAYGGLGLESLALTEFTARQKWYTPVEILRQATSGNAELFALSGKTNPYQQGALGVIQAGAYADLLLYDGNPLENLSVVTDPKKFLKLIIKDGKIYKDEL